MTQVEVFKSVTIETLPTLILLKIILADTMQKKINNRVWLTESFQEFQTIV